MAQWMIDANDPAREEIVRRALALGITGSPDRASHNLGEITLANGKKVTAHVVHAVDPIITDGDEVVMINRSNEPGTGKPALPGGFIDPTQGGVESAIQAAAREAMEEVCVTLQQGTLIGTRNMNRPFDVRVAQKPLPQYGIAEGDAFMVSTQAVRFDVPDLKTTKLVAGDDAIPGSARRVKISTLTKDAVGIPDHYDMIREALPKKTAQPDESAWADTLAKQNSAAPTPGRDHPIVWIIGATRSCKTAIAETGVAPLGFKHLATATYFRERYAKPDTLSKDFVFDISKFSADCLAENPDCHQLHLERVLNTSRQPYVIEGERNPGEFARLYDPKKDMVIFVNRQDVDKYDTVIERGIPVIEQYVKWSVSTGVAPQNSVLKVTFGGQHIKAERFGKGYEPDETVVDGEVKKRVPESEKTEDRYPWINFVNKIVSDAVKEHYGLKVNSMYDTPTSAIRR